MNQDARTSVLIGSVSVFVSVCEGSSTNHLLHHPVGDNAMHLASSVYVVVMHCLYACMHACILERRLYTQPLSTQHNNYYYVGSILYVL